MARKDLIAKGFTFTNHGAEAQEYGIHLPGEPFDYETHPGYLFELYQGRIHYKHMIVPSAGTIIIEEAKDARKKEEKKKESGGPFWSEVVMSAWAGTFDEISRIPTILTMKIEACKSTSKPPCSLSSLKAIYIYDVDLETETWKVVSEYIGKIGTFTDDGVHLAPVSEAFHKLLTAAPNLKMAVRLLGQHRRELGRKTINRISIFPQLDNVDRKGVPLSLTFKLEITDDKSLGRTYQELCVACFRRQDHCFGC